MLRASMLGGLVLATLLSLAVCSACAQLAASLADDLILLTNRLRTKEAARTHEHLGPAPGGMESPFAVIPGQQQPLQSEPSSAMTPGQANILPPPTLTQAPLATPIYGVLEIPAIADEGPPNGMTLDEAIERLIRDNPDLRTRLKQLPKAQADIVTAGLRNNPFLFGDVSNVPYGNYSPQRPGEVSYEVTIIQPWDVNQKRRVRVRVAESARNVLEFLYQDAVRLQIDNLYTAFLDMLAAREALRQQQVGLEGLEQIAAATRKQFEGGSITEADLKRVQVQRDMAFIAVQDAESALHQAKHILALLLNLPPADVDCLDLKGAIGGYDVDLPCEGDLIALACAAALSVSIPLSASASCPDYLSDSHIRQAMSGLYSGSLRPLPHSSGGRASPRLLSLRCIRQRRFPFYFPELEYQTALRVLSWGCSLDGDWF